ncbi:MAG: type II glyceraldehyde-3-phosphate dehydrogenase [Candidatus Asgardarchaeia archaeon]
MRVKVAVNGYGTIGKRVADAIKLQPDMELVGIAKTKPDYFALLAKNMGIDVYAIDGHEEKFENFGFKIKGALSDLLEKVDVVVDTAPGGKGIENKKIYEKAGVKMIFQGGEPPDVAEVSFVAQVNYEKAIDKNAVRVVSCNTTGMARVIHSLMNNFGVNEAKVVLIRRAADPKESKKGPINAIKPDSKIPSHHATDLRTVIPNINMISMAYVVPTTLMHVHTLITKISKNVNTNEIINVLEKTPRVILVNGKWGFVDTAQLIELARDFGRKRNDLYEVAIWENSIYLDNSWLYMSYAVHQEAIVVPENIDAIRAMFSLKSKEESIEITNRTLGIGKIKLS